jgi:hypothetical protein
VHETLFDYFAIIGFDNGQLRKLIDELLDGERVRGTEYQDEASKNRASFCPIESMGEYRVLKPSVLERFP